MPQAHMDRYAKKLELEPDRPLPFSPVIHSHLPSSKKDRHLGSGIQVSKKSKNHHASPTLTQCRCRRRGQQRRTNDVRRVQRQPIDPLPQRQRQGLPSPLGGILTLLTDPRHTLDHPRLAHEPLLQLRWHPGHDLPVVPGWVSEIAARVCAGGCGDGGGAPEVVGGVGQEVWRCWRREEVVVGGGEDGGREAG